MSTKPAPDVVFDFERYGGGGGLRIERLRDGGCHVFVDDGSDDEEHVFTLGREDTAILARTLLRIAGVKA